MDWTEKYRPSTLSEVRGNNKARDALKEWADTWESHREAIILHGTPGVGKTSAAHALANDMGWPTIELNASDSRTKDVIDRVAGEAAKSGTLTAGGQGRRLVIMDEADNIHGNADRGGARAVSSLVKEAGQPMILIANEFYEMSNSLRNNCQDVEFSAVQKRSIVPVLRDICRKEGVEYTDAVIEDIAEQNSGDLRGAIKDLQATAEGRDRIEADDYVSGERDTSEGIFEYLDVVLKEGSAEEALKASYDVDETPDDLINWIEDNMPKDYEGAELARAYGFLSNADKWLGRVRATQNYSFWRYAGDNMTAGVAAARDGKKGGWTRYGPPSYWSKLGRSKGARKTRDHIAQQIAVIDGVSMRTARREIMPFLATMTHHCTNRDLTVAMAATYELEAEHVSFVTGSGEDTNKVQSIVEDAERRREEAAVEHSGGAFEGATVDGGADVGGDGSETTDTADESGSEGGDGQSTLGDETTAADATADAVESSDGEAAEDDDQQSGLSDFM
ncbi:replication factor C large subunit [Halomicroarcula limicola]|uniref:Replication factor C large subunit n=1 Tax=Haloarcula limicola TaxID=1429915 RepID=A0A8J7Y598_9EURY|nr:replication factor C large subunit [Halomicroarcula limicola]MBV0924770.1 replication factor C large subunit [Halomicroarcula limicola]